MNLIQILGIYAYNAVSKSKTMEDIANSKQLEKIAESEPVKKVMRIISFTIIAFTIIMVISNWHS
jgi:hypothetical protein